MQPNAEENRRRKIIAPKSEDNSNADQEPNNIVTKLKFPRKPKDNLPEIFGTFAKSLLSSTDNNTDSFDKNSQILQVIRDSPYASDSLRALSNSDAITDSSDISMGTALTSTKRNLFYSEDNCSVSPTILPSSSEICDTENVSVETVIQNNVDPMRRVTRRNSMLVGSSQVTESPLASPAPTSILIKKSARKRRTIFATSKMTDFLNDSRSEKSKDVIQICDNKLTKTFNDMDISINKDKGTVATNNTLDGTGQIGVSTRRRTLYTPNSMNLTNSISEESVTEKKQRRKTIVATKTSSVTTPKKTPQKRTTVNNEITPPFEAHKSTVASNTCIIPATPTDNKMIAPSTLLNSVLRRQTTYTPKSMNETIVETQSPSTPELLASLPTISTSQQLVTVQEEAATQLPKPSIRRRTLFTPNKLIEVNRSNKMECRDQLFDTASCDAFIKTPMQKCKYINN